MSGLRKRIKEKIGREILEKHCQGSGPIMIPPIPDSKFFEKLAEEQDAAFKELQDGYEAEVKVYRCFEELKRDVIVIHQLSYTHEQYFSVFPDHACSKKKCKNGPEVHPCHQPDVNVDGETDFVVIGPDFVAVFEVKGLTVSKYLTCCSELISKCSVRRNGIKLSVQERNAVKFEGCCEDAARQRNRMVNLVKHLNSSIDVYQFTIFPNISIDEVDEGYLLDKTLLFSEDMDTFSSWFDTNIPQIPVDKVPDCDMLSIKRCLLGLWCINQDNKWDLSKCSLSKCILDVDQKLKKALVTRQAWDEFKHENISKKGKNKRKAYPENKKMVPAPNIFRKYLNIDCLTQGQLDVFNCEEKLVWIDGPAGSGKTIAMLGKIIDLALNTPPEERIVLIIAGSSNFPAIGRYLSILNNIRDDIRCDYKFYHAEEDHIFEHVFYDKTKKIPKRILSADLHAKISLLVFSLHSRRFLLQGLIQQYHHVFMDDYHRLAHYIFSGDHQFKDISEFFENIFKSEENADGNTFSSRLLFALESCKGNWYVSCDDGQSLACRLVPTLSVKNLLKFRDYFNNVISLSTNLRNTFEISATLSIIRTKNLSFSRLFDVAYLSPQEGGHFLRGTRPVIYFIKSKQSAAWKSPLKKELDLLIGPECSLDYKDIAVLFMRRTAKDLSACEVLEKSIRRVLKTGYNKGKITVLPADSCFSSEWPAVIVIFPYYQSNSVINPIFNVLNPELYIALSRARVYTSVILYDYCPDLSRATDLLLSELKKRNDVCRVVEY